MECTQRCRSKLHIQSLNAVIQNGTLEHAKAFLSTCHNALRGQDVCGRNVLHVAASSGKYELMIWLLEKTKGTLNTKDKESGWTALHRAVFYGQILCAQLLTKYGTALTCKDNENLTALDLCTRDHGYMPFVQTNKEIGVYNVYTWGDNSSYTLGHGKESRALSPEIVETFRKNQITINKVVMRRYHSIYLTSDGAVYTCGHGRGGRLGLGHEEPTLYPVRMKLPKVSQPSTGGSGDTQPEISTLKVMDIAAGRDHTMLLGTNGRVYSCGMNDHKQLGIHPDPGAKITEPKIVNAKPLLKGSSVTHIAAGRFHSAVATGDVLYTYGLNAGQLGHAKGDKHISPRVVSVLNNHPESRIQLIECCDAATVVVMKAEKREGFYILYQYSAKYVSFRGAKFDKRISCISISGGLFDHSQLPDLLNERGGSPLRVYWSNASGLIFLWTEDNGGLIRKIVYPSLGRQLSVLWLSASLSELMITSEEGGAYILTPPQKAPVSGGSTHNRFPDTLVTVDMKIRRVGGVHRATQCSVDPKSTNYAILQAKEYTCCFAEIDETAVSQEYDSLRRSADESDGVSDLILLCCGERIACHKYILSSRSSYFSKLICDMDIDSTHNSKSAHTYNSDDFDVDTFHIANIEELKLDCNIKILKFILNYIYSNAIDTDLILDTDVDRTQNQSVQSKANRKKAEQEKKNRDIIVRERVKDIGKQFGVKSIYSNRLQNITYSMNKYTEWYDVALTSSDGTQLNCHKCVLIARMEYFRTMLTGHWYEGNDSMVCLELPIPHDILYAVLLYVYTDTYEHIQSHDIEFAVNVMVVADQLLMLRLKQICESLIVSQLTLDNVTQVYQLASTYQTPQLKEAALFMICLNISEILELSLLDELEVDLLDELSRYYRSKMRCMSRRQLGYFRGGPSDTELALVLSESATGSGSCDADNHTVMTQTKRQRRRTRTSSHSSNEGDVSKSTSTNTQHDLNMELEDFAQEFTDQLVLRRESGKLPPVISAVSVMKQCDNTAPTSAQTADDVRSEMSTHSIPNTSPTPSSPLQTNGNSVRKSKGRLKYRSIDEDLPKPKTDDTKGHTHASNGHMSAPTPPAWGAVPEPSQLHSPMSLKEVMAREALSNKQHSNRLQHSKPHHGKIKWTSPSSSSTSASNQNRTAWKLPVSPSSPISPPPAAATTQYNGDSNQQTILFSSTSSHSPKESEKKAYNHDELSTSPRPGNPNPASVNLQDIMSEEAHQTEVLQRYANKPLNHVQIEEKAIEELAALYKAAAKPHEKITVERVLYHVTQPPLWKNQSDS